MELPRLNHFSTVFAPDGTTPTFVPLSGTSADKTVEKMADKPPFGHPSPDEEGSF